MVLFVGAGRTGGEHEAAGNRGALMLPVR